VLSLVAAVLLISGIADFVHAVASTRVLTAESIIGAVTSLLDEVLLVLILIEIVPDPGQPVREESRARRRLEQPGGWPLIVR
jgi:hypothetical protein